jgi:hypothetical protein
MRGSCAVGLPQLVAFLAQVLSKDILACLHDIQCWDLSSLSTGGEYAGPKRNPIIAEALVAHVVAGLSLVFVDIRRTEVRLGRYKIPVPS